MAKYKVYYFNAKFNKDAYEEVVAIDWQDAYRKFSNEWPERIKNIERVKEFYYPWEATEIPKWVEIVIIESAKMGIVTLGNLAANRSGNQIFKNKYLHKQINYQLADFLHEHKNDLWDFFNGMCYYSTPQGRIEAMRGTYAEQESLKSDLSKKISVHVYNKHH